MDTKSRTFAVVVVWTRMSFIRAESLPRAYDLADRPDSHLFDPRVDELPDISNWHIKEVE